MFKKTESMLITSKNSKIKNLFIYVIMIGIIFFISQFLNTKIWENFIINHILKFDIFDLQFLQIFSQLLYFGTFLLIFMTIMYFVDGSTPISVGFSKKNIFFNLIIGIILGFISFTIIYFLVCLLGDVKIGFEKNINIPAIVSIFIGFLIQGTAEEVILRGYLMNKISGRGYILFAILFNSILFSALHLANPGISFMAILNLTIFGIIFSQLFYITDNIWIVGAAHGIWNFTQSVIFGVLVSGLKIPYSIFNTDLSSQNELISGGNFGLEASIVTTIVGIFFILILYSYMNKKFKVCNVCCEEQNIDL